MRLKIKKELVKGFVLSHKICIICAAAGIFFGPAFFVGGLIAGFFADLIIEKINDEKKIENIFRDESFAPTTTTTEPFSGSMIVCALAVYSLGYAESAGKLAKAIFGKKYKCDWETLCRLAQNTGTLNGDLLTESLASKILHEKIDTSLLESIFIFLQAAEFNWNQESKGERPSVYLASLLNYSVKNDELENAYRILELEKDASISEVKKSHRRLASKYHPDSQGGNEEMFIKVQKAFETIELSFSN